MNAMLLLVPLALILLLIAVWALVWAVRRGQFDDLETPGLEPLSDDDEPSPHVSPVFEHEGVEMASWCGARTGERRGRSQHYVKPGGGSTPCHGGEIGGRSKRLVKDAD